MKIAFLLRFWPHFGGGETVTRVLANALCKKGHSVFVYYLWDRNSGIKTEIDPKINARKIVSISESSKDGVIPKKYYKAIEEQFRAFCKEDAVDIVINQWIPPKLCLKIVKGLDVKLITCLHTMVKYVPAKLKTLKEKVFYTIFGDNASYLRIYWKYKPGVLHSDRYVCLCKPYVDDIVKLYKVKDKEKVVAIANPCAYGEAPQDIINKKQKEIIYVGRVIDIKRVDFLIDIWKKIEDKDFAKDWRFTIVGEGPDLQYNKDYAKELGCKRVCFEGFKEPKEYYERASLFAFASCQEGWGLVLVEAQVHGCVPVVMNSSPCFEYIIQDGQNGYLTPEKDKERFAAALEKLMSDDDLRKHAALNAMESSKKYLASNIVCEWEKLFNDLYK